MLSHVPSTRQSVPKKPGKVLVIGGDGFLGRYIVEALVNPRPASSNSIRPYTVRVFDRQKRYDDVLYTLGDVTDAKSLSAAFTEDEDDEQEIVAVVHTVAAIPGAPGHVHRRVSVDGTRNVIDACLRFGVKTLVYTSSSSVVYSGGEGVVNGRETLPYAEKFVDDYSKYKAQAEAMVLEANGKNGLRTCALRPCGMFGPRDMLATTKIIQAAESGRTRFQIGRNRNLVDFTYIENIAHAHLLAIDKLSSSPSEDERYENENKNEIDDVERKDAHPSSTSSSSSTSTRCDGEAFNITNGEPIAFWDFPRALWSACDLLPSTTPSPPTTGATTATAPTPSPIVLPYFLGYLLASLLELFSRLATFLLGDGKVPPPTFTRFHVKFMNADRYFCIDKARRRLGYVPPVSLEKALMRTGRWYKGTKKVRNGSTVVD